MKSCCLCVAMYVNETTRLNLVKDQKSRYKSVSFAGKVVHVTSCSGSDFNNSQITQQTKKQPTSENKMVFYSTLLLTFLCSAHALPTDLTRYFGQWLIVGTNCCCPGRTQPRMWWMSTRSRRRKWMWKTRRRSRRFLAPSLLWLSHIQRGRG